MRRLNWPGAGASRNGCIIITARLFDFQGQPREWDQGYYRYAQENAASATCAARYQQMSKLFVAQMAAAAVRRRHWRPIIARTPWKCRWRHWQVLRMPKKWNYSNTSQWRVFALTLAFGAFWARNTMMKTRAIMYLPARHCFAFFSAVFAWRLRGEWSTSLEHHKQRRMGASPGIIIW